MNEKDPPAANTLLEQIEGDLVSLEQALAGRLSPDEVRLLSSVQQASRLVRLQLQVADKPAVPAEEEKEDGPTPASLAHAQTLAYAHDLVQTYRQSAEHRRRLELTEQQLIRAEKLATMSRVAATVAHELGNIVTPLLMYTSLLERAAADQSSEVVEIAGQMKQIIQRARMMVEQLAASARGDTGHTLPTDLNQALDYALGLLSPRFKKAKVAVWRQTAPDLPLVAARPGQLEQVFTNIAINALDAMPEGGQFIIGVTVESTASGDQSVLCVRFADTGCGIPPDHLPHVFDPFYTTKSGGAGSGLGLFVSHLIVDQHGGTIEIDSREGEGTTVIIHLPTAGGDFFDAPQR
jgi:two-component system NtrC family sensor kinase